MRAVKSAFEAAKSAIQVGHFDTEDVNNVVAVVNAIAEKCSNTIVSEGWYKNYCFFIIILIFNMNKKGY